MVRKLSSFGSFLVPGLVVLIGLSACKNQAPPAAETPSTEPPSTAANAAPGTPASPTPAAPGSAAGAQDSAASAPATAASSKYSEAAFDLALQPKGAYTSGQAGEAEIVLSAKPPFHVNDKYPYKFKVKEAPGLKFEKLVIAKDSVKLEPMRASVAVAFTPESAGKHTVAGQLSFSICTEDKCMIEKRDLAMDIDAK